MRTYLLACLALGALACASTSVRPPQGRAPPATPATQMPKLLLGSWTCPFEAPDGSPLGRSANLRFFEEPGSVTGELTTADGLELVLYLVDGRQGWQRADFDSTGRVKLLAAEEPPGPERMVWSSQEDGFRARMERTPGGWAGHISRWSPGGWEPALVLRCAPASAPHAPLARATAWAPSLGPIAWLVGAHGCHFLDPQGQPAQAFELEFHPELRGRFLAARMRMGGFSLRSHLGLDDRGRWVRFDVDSGRRTKLLFAEGTPGDSVVFSNPSQGFRERLDRTAEGFTGQIETFRDGAWAPAARLSCTRTRR